MTSVTRAAVTVRDLEAADRPWAAALLERRLGSVQQARLGEVVDALIPPGIVAERNGEPLGLATLIERDDAFELLALVTDPPGAGAGTRLLETAVQIAAASGHRRLWLVTTNDNLPALRFYLRRGMHVARIHADAVQRDRALKPSIPERNATNGLPVRDLVELEVATDAPDGRLRPRAVPAVEDLDALPIEALPTMLEPLVEGAPAFLARVAARRPFETDGGLVAAMREVARELSAAERVELVNGHPRIGAPPDTVSGHSRAEQGYDREAGDDAELARAYDELAWMNDLYEHRFGFRYVVFVAGRPKTAIPPLLEVALRNDREAELRRGVDDAVDIAADRLRTLRG